MGLTKGDKKFIILLWTTWLFSMGIGIGFMYYADSPLLIWDTKGKMFLGIMLIPPIAFTIMTILDTSIRNSPRPPSFKEIYQQELEKLSKKDE